MGTIFQPYYKSRKSITKADAKVITNAKTPNYCVVNQVADTDGEVETQIFKGKIIPTATGGAQVVLNEYECLKQLSPVTSPQRKRPSDELRLIPGDAELTARCSVGIQGNNTKRSKH